MTKNSRLMVVGLCVALTVFAASLSADDETTVTGTVYPVGWDKDNNMTEAVIITSDGKYHVTKDEPGQALLKLEYRKVRVPGFRARIRSAIPPSL